MFPMIAHYQSHFPSSLYIQTTLSQVRPIVAERLTSYVLAMPKPPAVTASSRHAIYAAGALNVPLTVFPPHRSQLSE